MNLPPGLNLDISIPFKKWSEALSDHEEVICRSLEVICQNIPEGRNLSHFSYLELGIVLCDDDHIQSLNRDFRNQDKATNVLSFEGLDTDERERFLIGEEEVPEMPFSLGEVYVAYETMVLEASEANISLKDHFYHLVVHGILHLLGYDHIEDDEAEVMEDHESNLLEKLGIDDPYAA